MYIGVGRNAHICFVTVHEMSVCMKYGAVLVIRNLDITYVAPSVC